MEVRTQPGSREQLALTPSRLLAGMLKGKPVETGTQIGPGHRDPNRPPGGLPSTLPPTGLAVTGILLSVNTSRGCLHGRGAKS